MNEIQRSLGPYLRLLRVVSVILTDWPRRDSALFNKISLSTQILELRRMSRVFSQ
jgi:hypothetical protein